MALQDTWKDLIDYESIVQASDINHIANAVIDLEKAKADGTIINKEAVVKALDYTPADEEAVSNEFGTETLETEAQTVKGAINELKRTSSLTKIINNASGEMITLKDATNDYYESINIYGKSTQDGTPTPEAPVPIVSVGDDGTVGVTSCGKNLISNVNSGWNTTFNNGVITQNTADTNANSLVKVQGVAPDGSIVHLKKGDAVRLGIMSIVFTFNQKLKTIRFGLDGSQRDTLCYFDATNLVVGETYTLQANFANVIQGTVSWKDMQLEFGSTATDYEPYKGSTASLTTALPLCSVGDVRDEVIFNADGTGKVVKKSHKINSYADEPIDGAFMSSTGELSEGATVVYALATPEEIDLTAEEVTALKSLMSYKGTTNVFNDGGSEMEIEYTADMKAYIDSILGVGG